jgi:hypothetical protein
MSLVNSQVRLPLRYRVMWWVPGDLNPDLTA